MAAEFVLNPAIGEDYSDEDTPPENLAEVHQENPIEKNQENPIEKNQENSKEHPHYYRVVPPHDSEIADISELIVYFQSRAGELQQHIKSLFVKVCHQNSEGDAKIGFDDHLLLLIVVQYRNEKYPLRCISVELDHRGNIPILIYDNPRRLHQSLFSDIFDIESLKAGWEQHECVGNYFLPSLARDIEDGIFRFRDKEQHGLFLYNKTNNNCQDLIREIVASLGYPQDFVPGFRLLSVALSSLTDSFIFLMWLLFFLSITILLLLYPVFDFSTLNEISSSGSKCKITDVRSFCTNNTHYCQINSSFVFGHGLLLSYNQSCAFEVEFGPNLTRQLVHPSAVAGHCYLVYTPASQMSTQCCQFEINKSYPCLIHHRSNRSHVVNISSAQLFVLKDLDPMEWFAFAIAIIFLLIVVTLGLFAAAQCLRHSIWCRRVLRSCSEYNCVCAVNSRLFLILGLLFTAIIFALGIVSSVSSDADFRRWDITWMIIASFIILMICLSFSSSLLISFSQKCISFFQMRCSGQNSFPYESIQ